MKLSSTMRRLFYISVGAFSSAALASPAGGFGAKSKIVTSNVLDVSEMTLSIFGAIGLAAGGWGIKILMDKDINPAEKKKGWPLMLGGAALFSIVSIFAMINASWGESSSQQDQKTILQGKKYGA